ncbi:hypothetical protein ACFP2T_03040 [Plantactinospora solaniradicis]|uniref:Lipoprotein LpqB beta-propeller domain-containing protein n=1 Tax=Plantactinospora solaniradicis TaxID=1723736 RepID=A0ABW1K133_9ACTN
MTIAGLRPRIQARLVRAQRSRLVGLVVALTGALALIALPPATGRQPAVASELTTIAQAWPDAERTDLPVGLADGSAYTPMLFFDLRESLGTAPSPDGTRLRLVLRSVDGAVRELRRLPVDRAPQYSGLTRSGDDIAWAESTEDRQGRARTEMWTVNLRSGQPARRLTTDTGEVIFFNSAYDMVLDRGRLRWASVAPGEETATEIRSVALRGGPVEVRTEPGAWAMSALPWLVSAGSGESGPVQLRNLDARTVVDVGASESELITCSPAWCRVLAMSGSGPSRIELMRPDGTDRRQVADGTASASVIDVGALDRFEVLSLADAERAAAGTQRLLLHDLRERRTVVVAEGVGMVLCRDGVLWWSTGETETTGWQAVDLRSLR